MDWILLSAGKCYLTNLFYDIIYYKINIFISALKLLTYVCYLKMILNCLFLDKKNEFAFWGKINFVDKFYVASF